MKTKKLMLISCLMVVFFYSSAQQITKSNTPSAVDVNAKVKPTPIMVKSNQTSGSVEYKKGLEGTPGNAYLNSEWQPGLIMMNDQSTVDNLLMRYNLYTQQIQFVKEGDTMAIGNPEDVKIIRIADKAFVYNEYLDNNIVKTGYFELRQDGKCRLLKRWKAIYHVAEESYTTEDFNSAETSSFIRDCQCYMQFGDQPAFSVSHRKAELINSFGDKSDRVEEFMKKSNLKMKNEEDLKMVINFYNSLE